MRKLQVVFAGMMLALTTSVASAQDAQPQRQGGGNPMAALLQGITLTADQQAKIDTLTKKSVDAMQALRADQSLDQEARRAKGRELRTKQYDDVKAILTDDQKKCFEKNLQDMQARMQGGGRPPQQ
jgi:Spy/CpxP family protein refolding chaperone